MLGVTLGIFRLLQQDFLKRSRLDAATTRPNMNNPSVSVIINNYNYAEYVGRAIESVLNQSIRAECIVVDDGSSDMSREVINAYSLKKTIFKENGGQQSAVLAALAFVEGDLVIILDADDFLYPNACERAAKSWRPGVALFQFPLDKYDTAGKKIGKFPNGRFLATGHLSFVLRHGYIPSSPMSGNAFSRDYLNEFAQLSLANPKAVADGLLVYGAPFFGDVSSGDEPLGGYLVHGRNMSPASGATFQSTHRQVQNEYWFREYVVALASRRGVTMRAPIEYLRPYEWRYVLLFNKGYRSLSNFRNIGIITATWQTIRSFVAAPDVSWTKKLVNIPYVLAIGIFPRCFARVILPEQRPHSRSSRPRNRPNE